MRAETGRLATASFCSGHRKPAPLLMVSGTGREPDTYRTPRNAMRSAGFAAGCPGVRLSHARTRVRVPAPARPRPAAPAYFFSISNGHPDTASNGATFWCPVPHFVADTAGHPAGEADTVALQTPNRMRIDLGTARPLLMEQGWSDEEIAEIERAIERSRLDEDMEAGLARWLRGKAEEARQCR